MLRSFTAVLLAAWVALVPALAVAAEGTMGAFSALGAEWAVPLSDDDLEDQRGGYGGLPFGVAIHFEGTIGAELGAGMIHVLDPNTSVADALANNPDAEVIDFLGSFAGFNGIGQWAVVNGDNNVVSNQLTVNIFITDGLDTIATFPDVLPDPAAN